MNRSRFDRLTIAARAIAYVPPHMLLGHLRRRVRDRWVPRRAAAYRAVLAREAAALPAIAAAPSPAARAAAATVATFFGAKHAKNVPQCLAGRFTFLNRTHDFGGVGAIDWRIAMDEGNHQLWRSNLAFMGYVCAVADAQPAEGLAFAAELVTGFDAAARFESRADFGELWHPYAVSQRTLALAATLIRLPRALVGTPAWQVVERFLRVQVAYLLRNLETELGCNHLERNLSALALYALAAGQMPDGVARALRGQFDAIVRDSFGDDGVQRERCPMYQGLCVQSLRVLSAVDLWTPAQRALLADRLAAVETAFAALCLGDGHPSMMNDGWFDEVPPAPVVVPAIAPPAFHAMRDAGYVRLASGAAVVLFDAGPIGIDSNPGHGHADFLSVEVSLGSERLIVDPGTYRYSAGAERDRLRAWDRHNGPMIVGEKPVEYLGSFKVGRRAAARLLATDGAMQSASGALEFAGIGVAREVVLTPVGLSLRDRWDRGAGERMTRLLVPDAWRIGAHGADGVELVGTAHRVRMTVIGGTLEIVPGQWSRRYNVVEDAHELRCRPQGDHMEIRFEFEPVART